jgi:hypothetical protein
MGSGWKVVIVIIIIPIVEQAPLNIGFLHFVCMCWNWLLGNTPLDVGLLWCVRVNVCGRSAYS